MPGSTPMPRHGRACRATPAPTCTTGSARSTQRTREYDRDFVPSLRSAYSEGAWELHTDVDGCVWFGGDFLGGPFVNGQRQYLEGFSKFCRRDTVAPSVPAASATLATGGVRLSWAPASDDRPGALGYEVLRNDRVVSPLVYGTSYTDPGGSPSDRYFVRSVDVAGNRSATTSVLAAADNLKPTTPRDLVAKVLPDSSVDLTWTASTDDIEVASYRVLRNGVEIALGSRNADHGQPSRSRTRNPLAPGAGDRQCRQPIQQDRFCPRRSGWLRRGPAVGSEEPRGQRGSRHRSRHRFLGFVDRQRRRHRVCGVPQRRPGRNRRQPADHCDARRRLRRPPDPGRRSGTRPGTSPPRPHRCSADSRPPTRARRRCRLV